MCEGKGKEKHVCVRGEEACMHEGGGEGRIVCGRRRGEKHVCEGERN